MNDKQRKLLCFGFVAMAVMGLFPPWVDTYSGLVHVRRNAGYGFIWSPPRSPVPNHSVEIDVERLILQCVVLGLVVACRFVFLGLRRLSSKTLSAPDKKTSEHGLGGESAAVAPAASAENAEAVITRKKYLKHEAAVRSVGSLYYFCAACYALFAVALLASERANVTACAVGLSFLVPLGAAFFWAGRGLRQVNRKVKPLATVLAVLVLVGGCCTLIARSAGTSGGGMLVAIVLYAYVLYVILSAKSKVVFSEGYKAVIEATPSIRYRTPVLVWVCVSLLVCLFLAALLLAIFAK